jgi:hypothetical protein
MSPDDCLARADRLFDELGLSQERERLAAR